MPPHICIPRVGLAGQVHEPEAARLRLISWLMFGAPTEEQLHKTLVHGLHMPTVQNPHVYLAVQMPVPFIGTIFFTSLIEFASLFEFNISVEFSLHVKI